MLEIDQYEEELLGLSFHAEPYGQLIAEFSGDEYIFRDCLRSLIRKKLLSALIPEKGDWKRTLLYDTDRLDLYRYQVSAKGIEMLEMSNE